MFTLKVKVVALILTSANIVLIPNLPQIQISILPEFISSSLSESGSPLSPSSIAAFTTKDCKPDLSVILDANLNDLPKAFETCTEEMSALSSKTHPDMEKTTEEVIKSSGYPLEIHKVTTADGYILTLHRIPRKGKTPVYLQHGLGGCSDNWILQYRDKSLAFLLWDNGYDVWLANFRGTTYSLEHKTLKWNDPYNYTYWDFSWHEIAIYDVPAITNYIIAATGKPKLFYVAHSMGTTTYFVALDLVPELNDKIQAGILMAPAGFVSRTSSPLRSMAQLIMDANKQKYLEHVFKGRLDFQRKDEKLNVLNISPANICTPTAIRCMACEKYIFSLFGMDAPQMNYTNIPNVLAKYPNIASLKSVFHYSQLANNCGFRQYDYGPKRNLLLYNSTIPPDYTLKNVRVPTYSFYGNFDNLCRPKDIKKTLDLLPEGTLKQNVAVNSTYFNHVDFLLAKDAQNLVYTKVIKIIKEVSQSL